MDKEYYLQLLKDSLNYVYKHNSFDNIDKAVTTITIKEFKDQDWDYSEMAEDSIRETLNTMIIIESGNYLINNFTSEILHKYNMDINNPQLLDDVQKSNLEDIIKGIKHNTIYMKDYGEYWTEL